MVGYSSYIFMNFLICHNEKCEANHGNYKAIIVSISHFLNFDVAAVAFVKLLKIVMLRQ